MVSNDVEAIPSGGGAYALLLTPKARVISDLEVFNTPAEPRPGVPAGDPRRRGRRPRAGPVPQEGRARAGRRGRRLGRRRRRASPTLETPIGPYRLVEQAPAENGAGDWEVARIEAGIPRFGTGVRARHDARRGRPRRAGRQLHEGLLSRPGADRAAALPRARQPRPARPARSRATRPSRARRSPPTGGRWAGSRRSPTRPEFGRDRPRGHPPRGRRPRRRSTPAGSRAVVRPLPFA